jgi:hypothetical protein
LNKLEKQIYPESSNAGCWKLIIEGYGIRSGGNRRDIHIQLLDSRGEIIDVFPDSGILNELMES